MVTEKTARAREAAAVNATKPYFEKVGRGIEYLMQLNNSNAEWTEKEVKALSERIEIEKEINIAEQKHQEEKVAELKKHYREIEKKLQKEKKHDTERLFSLSVRCEKCGAFVSQVQIVCHKCGAISKCFPYEIENAQKIGNDCYSNLLILSDKISETNIPITPYPEIEKQLTAISKIKNIAECYVSSDISDMLKERFIKIKDESEAFLKQSQDKKIEIAIVGKVKSGKSTLINALLGTRMASVNCTPETAVLVKYRTTKTKNYIKVSFYSTEQWQEIWNSAKLNQAFIERYNELKADNVKNNYISQPQLIINFANTDDLKDAVLKWTSSDYPEYYFVNEVEVGINGDQFPDDVILVDTPGLSDIVKYRSDITKHYLKNANFVLACVNYATINMQEEASFLEAVIANLQHDAKRMIIVGTQADRENMWNDVVKKQELFFKNIAPLFDNSIGVIRDHFVTVLSEPQLLLQEYLYGQDLSRTGKRILTNALDLIDYDESDISNERASIEQKFGISVLNKKLEEKVYRRTRQQIIELIKRDYDRTNQNIRSLANLMFENVKDDLLILTDKSEDYYATQDKIESHIKELSATQKQISGLLSRLSLYITKKGE